MAGNAFLRKAPRPPASKIKNPMLPTVNPSEETQDEYADNEAKKVGGVKPSLGSGKKPHDADKKKSAKGIEHMKSKDKNLKRQFSDVEIEVANRFGRDPIGIYADEPIVDDTSAMDAGVPVEAELPAVEGEPMPEAPAEEAPMDLKAIVSEKVDALKAIIDNKENDVSARQKKDIETAIDELSRYPAILDQVDEYVKEFAAVPAPIEESAETA